jgi:flagellar hook-length control protein FliK
VNINESRSPEARTHVDARRAPAINESAAIQRDRLIEDFQQRFERALASPASTPPSPQAAGAASEAGLLHASAASAWAAAAPQPAQPNNVAYINVPATVGTPAFAEDFSQRVVLLTRGKVHSAELSLTPAELGPVSVSIEVRGTEATLVFGSAHAATRAAIEEALPRLREMLSAQGLELTDARVGTQTGDGSPRDADHSRRQSAQLRREEIAPGGSTAAATPLGTSIVRSTRLIDVIA